MKLSTYSDGDSRRRLLKKCYAKHKKSIQENIEILKVNISSDNYLAEDY